MQRIWEFDNKANFSYRLEKFETISTKSFLEAIDKTVSVVFNDAVLANKQKIALCLSGIDSELIAHYLHHKSIPTEYFFLHIPTVNDSTLLLCRQISKKYNTQLNVVTVNFDKLVEYVDESFNITKVCAPTYLVIPYLLKNIPNEFYIVIGEGDLEKDNFNRYSQIYQQGKDTISDQYFYVPMHLTEISYSLALTYYGKSGESNFYSRTFDLWYHILRDPDLITNGKFFYDTKSKLFKKFVGDFLSPEKTLNFLNQDQKLEIIQKAFNLGQEIPQWHRFIGDLVKIPKSLII